MAKEYRINHEHDLAQLPGFIRAAFKFPFKVKVSGVGRTLSQNALAHMWYEEIAIFFIRAGRTHFASGKPINKYTVKENLKQTFLGFEEKTYTDMVTGKVTTTSELRHTSSLDKQDMAAFMREIDMWAMENGIPLSHPADSEYMQWREAA